MAVKLIFPPFSETAINGPHLAVPLLSAILNQSHIESQAIDLNIKLIRRLLKNDILEYVINALRKSDYEETAFEIACLTQIQSLNLEHPGTDYTEIISEALGIIRQVLFPVPESLAKCLKDERQRPEIVYELYSALLEDLHIREPDVIGFSVAFSEQLRETLLLAKIARKLFPGCRIILGGSQINLLGESQLAALKEIDVFNVIAVGDGEIIIKSAVEALSRNQHTSRIIRSGPIDETKLSQLPPPQFPDTADYFSPFYLPVLVAKGCFWGKCTFCDYTRLSDLGGKRYISRPVSEVLEEIHFLEEKYTPGKILLISNAVPPKWYRQLATQAISKGIRLKLWAYMLHSKDLDRSFFKLLSAAGRHVINFGTESTNDRILSVMKKNVTREVIFQNIRDAKDFGVRIIVNCIIDYPSTTRDEAFVVAHELRELLPSIDKLNPQLFDLTAGTPIAHNISLYDIELNQVAPVRSSHGYHSLPFKHGKTLSSADEKYLQRIYYKLADDVLKYHRVSRLNHQKWRAEDLLIFDLNTVLTNGKSPKLWLIPLHAEWAIRDWEYRLLNTIFEQYNGVISLKKLKVLFYKRTPELKEIDFTEYSAYLAHSGLIVKIRLHDK